jgi:RNA polymerase sigma factor (sigma-70 family)
MPRSDEEFEQLVGRHARLMGAAIRRVCARRHRALIPDVEQEVRLALWKRLESGKAIEHPTSYVYKVALVTALAMVRRQGGEAPSIDPSALPEPSAAPRGGLEPPERSRAIGEVLERLAPDEARALRAYLAGFDHVEVARMFGWSESVARHRIYRTLERLRTEARRGEEEKR